GLVTLEAGDGRDAPERARAPPALVTARRIDQRHLSALGSGSPAETPQRQGEERDRAQAEEPAQWLLHGPSRTPGQAPAAERLHRGEGPPLAPRARGEVEPGRDAGRPDQ